MMFNSDPSIHEKEKLYYEQGDFFQAQIGMNPRTSDNMILMTSIQSETFHPIDTLNVSIFRREHRDLSQ